MAELLVDSDDEYPAPQIAQVGGTIRWALGDPAERRSQTWNVVGHPNADDVYIGLRTTMKMVKLSLHRSTWLMAITDRDLMAILPPDVDRVVGRWAPTPETESGWRHAISIAVPHSSFQPGWPEPRVKRGAVAFYPPPDPGYEIRFDVLLSRPMPAALFTNAVRVGLLYLPSGAQMAIIAAPRAVDAGYERQLGEFRALSAAHAARGGSGQGKGLAWGITKAAVPILIDLGQVG